MAGYEVADPREAPLPVGPGIGLPPFAEVRAEVARCEFAEELLYEVL